MNHVGEFTAPQRQWICRTSRGRRRFRPDAFSPGRIDAAFAFHRWQPTTRFTAASPSRTPFPSCSSAMSWRWWTPAPTLGYAKLQFMADLHFDKSVFGDSRPAFSMSATSCSKCRAT